MKHVVLCCTIIAAAYGTSPPETANAQNSKDYKYCLYEGRGGGASDCSFDTFAQCQASASGRVADCRINPRYAFDRQRRR